MTTPEAKIFFKRFTGSIDAVMTMIVDGKTIVRRHPCRTGQRAFLGDEWARGRGPIPRGLFWLWLDPIDAGPDFPTTREGIGKFYNISNGSNRRLIVKAGNPSIFRSDIGLHPENALPGSAGCPVMRHETPLLRQQVVTVFNTLEELKEAGLKRIQFESFVGDRD